MLYAAYRDELDRLELWDRDRERAYAVARVENELEAWTSRPVLAYGFEDLTGAQWELLKALSGRAEVHVSLPYEPGRPAFASLGRTAADLTGLAGAEVEELPPAYAEIAHPALAHLERALFVDGPRPDPPPLDGAVRFLEGAGSRGSLELVADEVLRLLREGTPAEAVGLVCPSLERLRAPLETVLSAAGVPYAVEGRARLGQTPFGHSLLSALRFLWRTESRRDLFGFLRSPYSGLPRASADYLEGRLRGLGVRSDIEERVVALRGQPLPALDDVRAAATPIEAVRVLGRAMLRGAYGLEAPPVGEASRLDLRAWEAVSRLLEELEGWRELAGELANEDVLAALERLPVRLASAAEPGRVAVLDLLRARTRRFDTVFVLGLEEGSLPRRANPSPFLDDDARRDLDERTRSRLVRPDPVVTRALPLLRGLHAPVAAALPRAGGGDRRRRPAAGEPFLGRDARALRPGRRGAVDAQAAALRADLAARGGADGARAPPGARCAGRARREPRRPPSPPPTAGSGACSGPAPRSSAAPS